MAEILKELCLLSGVSGREQDVRDYITDHIKNHVDDINIDSLGNVIAYKKGVKGKKTIMLSSHMDEVGLILSNITDNGFIKFKAVGDIDSRNIVSKCVKINKTVDGVLGMKAIHLQKRDERENTVAIKDLYIDIGAKSKEKALKRVNLGDYISFESEYLKAGQKISVKALDTRVGCYVLLDMVKDSYEDNIYFVFTAQKQVGMRGASVAGYGLELDAALVLDAFESADMYGTKENEVTAKLGEGVCVDFMDKFAIPDKTLTDKLYNAIVDAKIPVQKKRSSVGMSDAGTIIRCADGVKTACIGIPVRYMNTPQSMADMRDIKAMRDTAVLFAHGLEDIII